MPTGTKTLHAVPFWSAGWLSNYLKKPASLARQALDAHGPAFAFVESKLGYKMEASHA
jgi:hypothetical protein